MNYFLRTHKSSRRIVGIGNYKTTRCLRIGVEHAKPDPTILDRQLHGHVKYLDLQAFLLPILCHRANTTSAWEVDLRGWSIADCREKARMIAVVSRLARNAGGVATEYSVTGMIMAYHPHYLADLTVIIMVLNAVNEGQQSGCYERTCDGLFEGSLGHVEYNEAECAEIMRVGYLEFQSQKIRLE